LLLTRINQRGKELGLIRFDFLAEAEKSKIKTA